MRLVLNSLDALVESTAGDVECTIRAAMFEQLKRPVHFTSYWNSRIDVYIHQIETALSVLEMKSPRVLLADEVGLGKTIEALLILKEWIVRNEASRVLVVLPSNLSSQWQYEMESKFSLFPIIVDRGNLGEVFSQGNEGLYLVSIDFAKRHLEEFSGHDWDVVLFDEAHHLRRHLRRGNKIESTLKYELGRALSPKTNGLLLLTATPMQLDEFEFYSILLLIDENLFPTYDDFLYYYETLLPRITRALERIRDEAEELDLADLHMLYDRGRRCLDYLELPELSDDCEDLDEIQGHLESLIVFPDFMIRHRKREEFPELPPREVSTIPIVYSDYERGIYEDITRFFREVYGISKATNSPALGLLAVVYQQMLTSSPRALANSLRRRLKGKAYLEDSIPGDYEDSVETEALRMLPGVSPLSEAHILHDFVTRLEEMPIDSKLEALVKLVGNVLLTHPDEKILVFTRFLDTQDYLAKTLGKHFDVVTFNGKMDARTKDENVMKFRKSARVMISSEAGGEGRNFQFSHIMVNYDLPWNPVRLEQRIGRIDRIGQQRNVIVYNMAIDGTVEERIFKALADRVFRFESLVGAADTILGNIETDIAKVVLAQDKLLENREYDQFTRTLDAKI
ncbi:MAG: DEAD/DEAH box helicase, partial [Thermoplasmata archaeon]